MKTRKYDGKLEKVPPDHRLQWGRADEDAEIARRTAEGHSDRWLQWGRADEDAEMNGTAYWAAKSASLQWGRADEDAEIIAHFLIPGFQPLASMGPRR